MLAISDPDTRLDEYKPVQPNSSRYRFHRKNSPSDGCAVAAMEIIDKGAVLVLAANPFTNFQYMTESDINQKDVKPIDHQTPLFTGPDHNFEATTFKDETMKPETGKKRKYKPDRHYFAYFLLLPTLVIITTFHVLPIFYSFALSTLNWDLISKAQFVGLRNFRLLAGDALFWKSVWNTLYYTALSVPLTLIFSLSIAVLLNNKIKGIDIYRIIYFIPVITSINAVSIVWKLIYHPNYGLLNKLLALVEIPPQRWLLDPKWAMASIVLMSVWKGLGYNVILFLTGLKNIPQHLYEAATVTAPADGTNSGISPGRCCLQPPFSFSS